MTKGQDAKSPNLQAEALLPLRETLEVTSQWGQPVPTVVSYCKLPRHLPPPYPRN